ENDLRMSRFWASVVGFVPDGPGRGSTVSENGQASAELFSETLDRSGRHLEIKKILDVRKAGFVDRDWIVSRRRNRNLFDFVAMLRKFVLVHDEDSGRGSESHMDDWEQ